MKLKKYQQGGGLIYTPFIPQQMASVADKQSNASGSADEDAKIDPLDKELLGLMKDKNLLPSDIQVIYNRLVAFQKKSQKLSELPGFGGTDSYRSIMPNMLQIMNLTSIATHNKEQWDTSLAEIKKHNAGSEVAMDSYGRIWVADEDGVKKITLSDFDPEKHQPLSNSQLLYMRQRNPALGFQDDIFEDTWMDVVGMDDVRKEIYEIIAKFGTIKSAEFQKQTFKDIAEDLQGEGIYKIATKYSKADLNDFSSLLYSQLSREAKNLINANAKIGGFEPQDFIRSIISSQTSVEVDPTYEASLTKANNLGGEGGSGDSTENLVADSYIEELTRGNNFGLPRYTYFNPTSKFSMMASIQDTGVIRDYDGKDPIGPGMVDAVFEKTGLKEISPQMSVTFGDQIIDETNLGALLYDGSSLQRIDLPYTEINGEITVDWETVEAVEQANEQLRLKSATPGMIKELLKDNPKLVYNEKLNRVQARNHMWFLTFGAIMGHDFAKKGVDYTSKYIERMGQEKSEFWGPKYEEAAQYGFVNHEKNASKRTSAPTDKTFFNRDWFGDSTKYYHGNVFMPITNQLAGATEYSPKASRMNNMQTQAMSARDAEMQEAAETGILSFNW